MKINNEIVKGQFGSASIYPATNQPSHAVVAKKNWLVHGNQAVAISHHWSESMALQMARVEQWERNEDMIVVEFVLFEAPKHSGSVCAARACVL